MKAIVLTDVKKIEIKEIEKPKPKAHEVLIEVKASGICTNDTRDYLGVNNYSLPRVGGHEFSGVIREVGSDVSTSEFKIGDHVVKYIIPYCQECYFCKNKRENLCVNVKNHKTFQNKDDISGFGGFANYVISDAKDIYKIYSDVSYDETSFVEPLACVINSVNRATINFGDDVLVIGAGVMGLLHIALAKMKGARVIVSEPNEERRKFALKYGANDVFNPFDNQGQELFNLTRNLGANAVFNTNEHPKVAAQAVEFTATGGEVFMFSSIHPNEPVPVDMGVVHSYEKVITGTVSPTLDSYHQAVTLIDKKMIDVKSLIDQKYSVENANDAFEHALKKDSYKIIINF